MTWSRLLPMTQGIGGTGFLVYAVALSHRLRKTVPDEVRRRWQMLTALMYFFIVGYVAFVGVVASDGAFPVELVTGSVFLGGAVFVFLVIDLSRSTIGRMRASECEIEAAQAQLTAQNLELEQKFAELQQLAARLTASEADWQDSFDIIDEAITIHDLDFHILRANRAARELFGDNFETFPGLKCYQAYHGSTCQPENCPSCRTSTTGQPAETEVFEPHLNRFVSIRALPRRTRDGKMVGVIHVVADITERKRRE